MAVNISKVYLLSVPLEDDLKNTLYFASASAQHTYFANNVAKTYTNVSYQSETRTFRCPDQIDTVRQYNYLMWQNTAYTNKWFYAFIKKMTYVSDGYTDVEFEVDPLQTFMFDITIRPSFVEREHTNNDAVGSNLVPEGLEHGEYVANGSVTSRTQLLYYVINADKEPATDGNGNPTNPSKTYYSVNAGGIPMSGGLFVFPDMARLTNAFLTYSRMTGGLDHIKNVYIATSDVISDDDLVNGSAVLEEYYYRVYKGRSNPFTTSITLSAPATIDGYTPKNNKLLSAPYQYMLISNNNGSVNQLNYEYFANRNSITIEAKGVPTIGGSIIAYPKNYKGYENNYHEGIIGGKLPTLSWSGDAWTNWLTQNSVNIGANIATTALGIGASVATGLLSGGVGAVIGIGAGVSGITAVTNQLTEMYDHSIVPNTFKGNTNGGDVLTSNRTNKVYAWKMSITAQFAQIIDNYFDLYGYKTNRVKVPNVAHRQNWWYTKTINANIVGNVPNEEMNKIKEAYNNGLTFWRNASNFLNYNASNGIV